MLTCQPQSFFSWDYRVQGAVAGPALLTFDSFAEEGGITLGAVQYTIRKQGALSGRWNLLRDGKILAEAHKPDAFTRLFQIRTAKSQVSARAESPFSRRYAIIQDRRKVGTIRPIGFFRRQVRIECSSAVPELAQLFCFWLAVMTWRRAQNRNDD